MAKMNKSRGKSSDAEMPMRNTMEHRGDSMEGNTGRPMSMGMKSKGNKRTTQTADRYT